MEANLKSMAIKTFLFLKPRRLSAAIILLVILCSFYVCWSLYYLPHQVVYLNSKLDNQWNEIDKLGENMEFKTSVNKPGDAIRIRALNTFYNTTQWEKLVDHQILQKIPDFEIGGNIGQTTVRNQKRNTGNVEAVILRHKLENQASLAKLNDLLYQLQLVLEKQIEMEFAEDKETTKMGRDVSIQNNTPGQFDLPLSYHNSKLKHSIGKLETLILKRASELDRIRSHKNIYENLEIPKEHLTTSLEFDKTMSITKSKQLKSLSTTKHPDLADIVKTVFSKYAKQTEHSEDKNLKIYRNESIGMESVQERDGVVDRKGLKITNKGEENGIGYDILANLSSNAITQFTGLATPVTGEAETRIGIVQAGTGISKTNPNSFVRSARLNDVTEPNKNLTESMYLKSTLSTPFKHESDIKMTKTNLFVDSQKDKASASVHKHTKQTIGSYEQTLNHENKTGGQKHVTYVDDEIVRDEEDSLGDHLSSVCEVPDLDPWDKSIRRFLSKHHNLRCHWNASLTYVDGAGWLHVNQTVAKEVHHNRVKICYFHKFDKWPNYDDNVYYQSTITTFIDKVRILDNNFVHVGCNDTDDAVIYENLHHHIKRPNAKIVQKIKRAHAQKDASLQLGVTIFGIDSTSRSNFIRQLPKSYKYLTETMHALVFKSMNKIGDNTFPNLVPLLTGRRVEGSDSFPAEITERPWLRHKKLYYDDYPIIWKNFSAKNYITMLAEDRPSINLFNYMARGFKGVPVDYYLRPFHVAMDESWIKANSTDMCFADKPRHVLQIDWFIRFMKRFSKFPTFSLTWFNELSHEYLNDIQVMDDDVLKMLKEIYENSHLNNTMFILMGDHGNRFDAIRQTFIGRLEDSLPFFSVTFPPWFLEKYPRIHKALKTNRKRLITVFDVHETLKNILDFKADDIKNDLNNRGLSLFSEIPANRTCDSAGILENYCACHEFRVLNTTSNLVIKIAKSAVKHLNNILLAYKDKCAHLYLSQVKEAHVIKRSQKRKNTVEYLITIETRPGNALFEITMTKHPNTKQYEVVGDISRINKYGNQSDCIGHRVLRKVCYCKKYTKTYTRKAYS